MFSVQPVVPVPIGRYNLLQRFADKSYRMEFIIMGLVEKRMLAQLRDEIVLRYQSELREITGSDILYAVD